MNHCPEGFILERHEKPDRGDVCRLVGTNVWTAPTMCLEYPDAPYTVMKDKCNVICRVPVDKNTVTETSPETNFNVHFLW